MLNDSDMMPDGFERERRETLAAFWKCLGATIGLSGLTAVSYLRPDWIQLALSLAAFFAAILTVIGAQEIWRLRRGNIWKR